MMWLFYLGLSTAMLAMMLGSGFANYFWERCRWKARRITLVITYTLTTVGISVGGYCGYWETNYGGKIAPVLVEKRCKTVLRGTP